MPPLLSNQSTTTVTRPGASTANERPAPLVLRAREGFDTFQVDLPSHFLHRKNQVFPKKKRRKSKKAYVVEQWTAGIFHYKNQILLQKDEGWEQWEPSSTERKKRYLKRWSKTTDVFSFNTLTHRCFFISSFAFLVSQEKSEFVLFIINIFTKKNRNQPQTIVAVFFSDWKRTPRSPKKTCKKGGVPLDKVVIRAFSWFLFNFHLHDGILIRTGIQHTGI